MRNIYDDILRDARVKLTEMFDNNFREQGFFGKKWAATKISKTNKRDTVQDWRNDVYQTLVDVGNGNRIIFDTRSFTVGCATTSHIAVAGI